MLNAEPCVSRDKNGDTRAPGEAEGTAPATTACLYRRSLRVKPPLTSRLDVRVEAGKYNN